MPSTRRKYANYNDFVAKRREIENDPESSEWERLQVKIEARRFDMNLWEKDVADDEEIDDEYRSSNEI